MRSYKNKRNGNVISVESEVISDIWEPIEAPSCSEFAETEEKPKRKRVKANG